MEFFENSKFCDFFQDFSYDSDTLEYSIQFRIMDIAVSLYVANLSKTFLIMVTSKILSVMRRPQLGYCTKNYVFKNFPSQGHKPYIFMP